MGGGADNSVLRLLILAGGGNVLGLKDQSGSGVGDGFGQREKHVLKFFVFGSVFANGRQDLGAGFTHAGGCVEKILTGLKFTENGKVLNIG